MCYLLFLSLSARGHCKRRLDLITALTVLPRQYYLISNAFQGCFFFFSRLFLDIPSPLRTRAFNLVSSMNFSFLGFWMWPQDFLIFRESFAVMWGRAFGQECMAHCPLSWSSHPWTEWVTEPGINYVWNTIVKTQHQVNSHCPGGGVYITPEHWWKVFVLSHIDMNFKLDCYVKYYIYLFKKNNKELHRTTWTNWELHGHDLLLQKSIREPFVTS